MNETSESRFTTAIELFKNGSNCSQSVLATYFRALSTRRSVTRWGPGWAAASAGSSTSAAR